MSWKNLRNISCFFLSSIMRISYFLSTLASRHISIVCYLTWTSGNKMSLKFYNSHGSKMMIISMSFVLVDLSLLVYWYISITITKNLLDVALILLLPSCRQIIWRVTTSRQIDPMTSSFDVTLVMWSDLVGDSEQMLLSSQLCIKLHTSCWSVLLLPWPLF